MWILEVTLCFKGLGGGQEGLVNLSEILLLLQSNCFFKLFSHIRHEGCKFTLLQLLFGLIFCFVSSLLLMKWKNKHMDE